MMAGSSLRIAVVGATGLVGQVMLSVLKESSLAAAEIVPFASERSAGKVLADGLTVQPLNDDTIQHFDIAIFSAGGGISREWAPKFTGANAVVVDNSSAWRMDDEVPLVVAEVNPEALDNHNGIIANPNCSTMQMVVALKPLYDAAGIERLVISTYQAVSGTGKAALEELRRQAEAVLANQEIPQPEIYPHHIAFNALPQAGTFAESDDHTDEERKLMNETRKILGDTTIRISATCVRVPVFGSHSEAVNVETKEHLSLAGARSALQAMPGLTLIDEPGKGKYPLARDIEGSDGVFVGRLRRDPGNERAFDMWVVADNLRKGAATNAVQIAELIVEKRLLRR